MRFKAVLLDMDGTLLDTIADIADACNAMLTDLKLPELSEETVRSYVGKGSQNLVMRALVHHGIEAAPDSTQARQAVELFFEHYRRTNGQRTQIYPGVLEGLRAFQQAQLKMAVVTNKTEEFTHTLLTRTGLTDFFDVVVGGDTCTHKKPHPLPFQHACTQLDVSPADALVIGDSINDAQAARAAGIPVLIVPYGYNEGLDVHSLDVDDIVSTIDEAARWAAHKQQPARTT